MNHVLNWATLETLCGKAATVTYRWGYSTARLTLAEMETRWTWNNVHPEVRRRAVALMDASQAAGHDLGIGEGARNTTQQLAEFLRRHNVVSSGGCCTWQGKRYALKAGMAPIAPPGNSNHEQGVYEGGAIAIDFVGWEDHWFDANCERFGIKNFGGAIGPGVNGEEWHGQPIEFPNSRKAVNTAIAAGKTLTVWPLPGTPPPTTTEEVDMIAVDYKPDTPEWVAFMVTGTQMAWVYNGHADGVYRVAGVGRVTVGDDQLDGLIASSQTTTNCPPSFSAQRQTAWNARRG